MQAGSGTRIGPESEARADSAAELIERLRLICGSAHVITDRASLQTYRSDGLLQHRQLPLAAVLPGTVAEVQALVRACSEHAIPFVARGAGTGLAGGALPHPDGILVVLARLRRIERVDLEDGVVVAEAGVTNLAVSRAVGPSHFYPPDPSSRSVCTLGGNVATNAGGAHCLKYGVTASYVLGLDVVLADGTLVELRRDAAGYDLVGAFVGSEGAFGIAVRVHLRVIPVPERVRLATAFFQTPAAAAEAVGAIVASGVLPAALELLDQGATAVGEQATGAGFRTDAGATLLVELDGSPASTAAQLDTVTAILTESGALDIEVASDRPQRERAWALHRAVLPAFGRIASSYHAGDPVVPRPRLGEILRRIEAVASAQQLRVLTILHAGDGNLHLRVLYDERRPGESRRARALVGEITRACVELGGSITGEHGVGVDKAPYLPLMFEQAEIAAFERLRRAFDPHGLANPGKTRPPDGAPGTVSAGSGAAAARSPGAAGG